LLPSQVDTLNANGEVTINLVDMGFIGHLQQKAKILDVGASQITAALEGPFPQLANVRFEFIHSGVSLLQDEGSNMHSSITRTVHLRVATN
jgi:hypothetical protein